MHSNTQVAEGNRTRAVFSDFGTTFRTLLRCSSSINFRKELSAFPTDILDKISELSKRSIKHMFSKHSFGANAIVQVFHEDHVGYVTKPVGLLEMKVFASVVNRVVHPGNLETLLLVIFGPFLFSTQSALRASFAGFPSYTANSLSNFSSLCICLKNLGGLTRTPSEVAKNLDRPISTPIGCPCGIRFGTLTSH